LIRQALAEIKSGNPTFIRQDNEKATYFPKRSESDGKINWAWHRNRIINWVRAQTSPYPGAFSINPLTGEKIRILDCHAVDLGFHSETLDGTVLSIENDAFSVKCPNGVVCISSFKGEVMPGIQLV
jgi:methionyl-tRNA formyltransferase